MDAPLASCTTTEQRAVIRFLESEGVKPAEIHRRMLVQYGSACIHRRNVYKWAQEFRQGRNSIVDSSRCGRPTVVATDALKLDVEKRIKSNRKITVEELAHELDVSVGTVHKIIRSDLNFTKKCAHWIPRVLSQADKQNRVRICRELKQRFDVEGETFLERIITCDETWIYDYEPESRTQSMEWKHPHSPAAQKVRKQMSANKILLTVFWDMQGPVLCHYLEGRCVSVNSASYSELLKTQLKPAIRSRRRGALTKGVILQHDNARPHSAKLTQQTLQDLGWEVLPHPPYSPDLAPSDFHLFGPLKFALSGRVFKTNEEIKAALQSWLAQQPKEYFAAGILSLAQRWDKCIRNRGEFLDKMT